MCRSYLVLQASDSLLLEANIEGAVQQLLIVSATVQHHGQADRGGYAATGCVQSQLAHRHTHRLQHAV